MSASNSDSLPKTPGKETLSPFSKKLKVSDSPCTSTRHACPMGDIGRQEAMEMQKAEPTARRSQNLPSSPQPQADLSAPTPLQWFLSFF